MALDSTGHANVSVVAGPSVSFGQGGGAMRSAGGQAGGDSTPALDTTNSARASNWADYKAWRLARSGVAAGAAVSAAVRVFAADVALATGRAFESSSASTAPSTASSATAFEEPIDGPNTYASVGEGLLAAHAVITGHPQFGALRRLGEFGTAIGRREDGTYFLTPLRFKPCAAPNCSVSLPSTPDIEARVHSHPWSVGPSWGDISGSFLIGSRDSGLGRLGAVIGPDDSYKLFVPYSFDKAIVRDFPIPRDAK